MVFLITGPDSYRARKKLASLRDKFYTEVDSSGLSSSTIDGSTLEVADVRHHLSTGSLIARRRLLIIENLFSQKKLAVFDAVEEAISQQVKDGNVIIFYEEDEPKTKHKLLAWLRRHAYCQSFPKMGHAELQRFVKEEFNNRERQIVPAAVDDLLRRVGDDPWALSNAIQKIDAYLPRAAAVDTATVMQLSVPSVDDNIFGLVEAITSGDLAAALPRLSEQLDNGLAPELLITLLEQQLRIIFLLTDSSPTNKKALFGVHPYVIKKLTNVARAADPLHTKEAYTALADVDLAIKTGQLDGKTALVRFLTTYVSAKV
ncbi:MAG: DNA polymerase III subunit delta [Patescibacteria group bacterium]|jgi:DNA polymerase-3 subunit delta